MLSLLLLTTWLLAAGASAQQKGTLQKEDHPKVTWQTCTGPGACTPVNGEFVIDANWRWLHTKDGSTNCYTKNEWNTTSCPDNVACAANCALEGADYKATYGIESKGDAISLTFVTKGKDATNVGSRLYLMKSPTEYQHFDLIGNEFSFDVDVSQLGCGLNGAVYFVAMDADGGMSRYPTNMAGAELGTGYCDSQCPRDLKFIDGKANVEGWQPSSNDDNAGVGNTGSCCSEMDIWEANSESMAFTPHPCETAGQISCQGDACGGTYSGATARYDGQCDPDGCDWNPYRMGNKDFYGKGKTVDTAKKVTVVTQWVGSGGAATEIRQSYIQDGVRTEHVKSSWPGLEAYDSISDESCAKQKEVFGDPNIFAEKGGMAQMSAGMKAVVAVFSVWNDHYANMLWLDSLYPTDADPSAPGKERGRCPSTGGVPDQVEAEQGNSVVTFSNIKFGPIGSTNT